MGEDHKPKVPKVPDWRIYKVEDSPELKTVQEALASYGLKHPWLRNEVWKFVEPAKHRKRLSVKGIFTFGFKYGLIAAIITTAIENALFGNSKHPVNNGTDH